MDIKNVPDLIVNMSIIYSIAYLAIKKLLKTNLMINNYMIMKKYNQSVAIVTKINQE